MDARPAPGTGQTNAAFFGDLNFGSSGLVFDRNYLLGANITTYHIGRRPPNGNGECPVATQWSNNVVLGQPRVYTNAQTADGLIECPVVDGQGGVWNNNTCVSETQAGSAEWQTDGRCSGTVGETQPSCSDGIRNGDEEGTDCGGSCPSCDGFQDAGSSDGGLSTMDTASGKPSAGCSAMGGSTPPVPAVALAILAVVMRSRRRWGRGKR